MSNDTKALRQDRPMITSAVGDSGEKGGERRFVKGGADENGMNDGLR